MEERNISYGELAELQDMFEEQTAGIQMDDEQYNECMFDFIDQYIHGNDMPEVVLPY